MSWSDAYIGIPYLDHGRTRDGVDCWGLLALVYREERGLDLPRYDADYQTSDQPEGVAPVIRANLPSVPFERVNDIRPFDALLFRRGRVPAHVGIAVTPRHFLHIRSHHDAQIERLDQAGWPLRLLGAYRHDELARRWPL